MATQNKAGRAPVEAAAWPAPASASMSPTHKTDEGAASDAAAMVNESMRRPIFEPFRWVDRPNEIGPLPAGCVVSTASTARDLANGIRTVLQLIERDMLDRDQDDIRPTLNEFHTHNLMRMAIAAAGCIASEAADLLNFSEQHRSQGGAA